MTTISKADDKRRLTIPGLEGGRRYLVNQQLGGWWVEPARESRRNRREWKGSKRDLSEHLDEMARHGFAFEPMPKEKVPKCHF